MITEVSKLDFKCKKCKKRADFAVTRTNDDLPEEYCKSGTRGQYFCRKHVPKDVRKYWNSEIPDFPEQQL